jgi:hypothetical protein
MTKKKRGNMKTKAEKTTEDSDPTTARTISARENNLLLSATLLSGGDGDGAQHEQQNEDRENKGTRKGLSSKLLPTSHRPTDAGLPSWGWC